VVHQQVYQLQSLMRQLSVDLDNGLVLSIERQLTADTFEDMLAHAEEYLKENRKEPAGVLAGVVFEDTIRKLCKANQVADEQQTLDPLINALKRKNVISKMETNEALSAAGLRTAAIHARWEEYSQEQVRPVIEFTRRLIRDKLAPPS
jgi:hypothetical protein